MSFFHFYFAVQVSGGIPFVGGEGSGGLTIRLEAGSKAGQVCHLAVQPAYLKKKGMSTGSQTKDPGWRGGEA